MPDYSAIKISEQAISVIAATHALVFWEWQLRSALLGEERFVRTSNKLDILTCD